MESGQGLSLDNASWTASRVCMLDGGNKGCWGKMVWGCKSRDPFVTRSVVEALWLGHPALGHGYIHLASGVLYYSFQVLSSRICQQMKLINPPNYVRSGLGLRALIHLSPIQSQRAGNTHDALFLIAASHRPFTKEVPVFLQRRVSPCKMPTISVRSQFI